MAHTNRIGHGTKFHRSDDGTSSGSFAAIGVIDDIGLPTLARDVEESTDMESTDRWKEFIGAMRDAGEMSIDITFDPGSAETTTFMTDLNSDAAGYYKMIFPDATEWGSAMIMTGFEPTAPREGKMTATVTFKLTGKPGWIS